MGVGMDITDRKRTELELQNSYEQLQQLAQYTEKARESERKMIARELHDELGQALTAVKIDLRIIKQHISDQEVNLKIDKTSDLVGETIKTVQRLTSQLRPEIIDDLGLNAAIKWYTKEFAQRNGIEIFLDMDSEIAISPDDSLTLFRIMQESLTNVARHSKANHVVIKLIHENGIVNFRISDNGIGISDHEINAKKSFGIIGIKERASSLAGTCEIYSEDGYGTIINLTFPLNKKWAYEDSDLR
jgi:signal transduction histidine kinase